MRLVPRLWFLGQTVNNRIFQNKSLIEIMQDILHAHGFTAEETAFRQGYGYEAREYCVQYGESDLHFLSRVAEEEGIYFYLGNR